MATASAAIRSSPAVLPGLPPVSSQPTENTASTQNSATRVTVTLSGQVSPLLARLVAIGAPMSTPTEYPASAVPLWIASDDDCVAAATPSRIRFPVMTLLNTLPRCRKEDASTAPVVRVSSTSRPSRAAPRRDRVIAGPMPAACSQPAAAAEEDQHAHHDGQLGPHPEYQEGAQAAEALDHPAEVLAEEPGEEGQRQEDGGDEGELLHDHVELVRHGGQVGVHRAGQQIAVAVHEVADPDQVVVQIPEVALDLPGHAGQLVYTGDQRGDHVTLRRDHLPHADQPAFGVEELGQLLVGRLGEDRVLQLVDAVIEPRQDREEAIGQLIEYVVHQEQPADGLGPVGQPVTHLGEGCAIAVPDGHQVPLGVEEVNLDHVLARLLYAVGDQLREVVVVLDLRALPELGGILNGKLMDAELGGQDAELVSVRPVEVKPEQLALVQQPPHRLAARRGSRAVLLDQESGHGHIVPNPAPCWRRLPCRLDLHHLARRWMGTTRRRSCHDQLITGSRLMITVEYCPDDGMGVMQARQNHRGARTAQVIGCAFP